MTPEAGSAVMVTGATGTVGSALTAELVAAGLTPRLLVRPGSRSGIPGGTRPVEADLDDPDSVLRAFKGIRSLFLLTPMGPRQDTWQTTLIEAAVTAQVEHIVKVSALGADPESAVTVHRQHGVADRFLASTGVPHVILRPNAFMQNVRQWRAGIERRGVIELPMQRSRVSMIDARDIARVASRVLLRRPDVSGTHDLTGPDALSYADIARYVSRAWGKSVRYVDAAPETAAANMRASGAPEWAITARLELYASIRAGEAATVSPAVARITGREPRSLGDYLDEHGSPRKDA